MRENICFVNKCPHTAQQEKFASHLSDKGHVSRINEELTNQQVNSNSI
jgi:hypothetical protein